MAVQLLSILTACTVGLTSVQLHPQTIDRTITKDESETRESFQNLFDSIAKNDIKNTEMYRKNLKQEVTKERLGYWKIVNSLTGGLGTCKGYSYLGLLYKVEEHDTPTDMHTFKLTFKESRWRYLIQDHSTNAKIDIQKSWMIKVQTYAFATVKEELRMAQSRNFRRKGNLFRNGKDSGDVGVIKRETNEKKNLGAVGISQIFARHQDKIMYEMKPEETVRGVDVFDRMRNLVHNIEHNLILNKKVYEDFERIGNLSLSDIPPTVNIKNETAVESFQQKYRTYFAILRTLRNNDDVLSGFKGELQRCLNQKLNFTTLARLMAQFSCLPSELEDDEHSRVDWWDEREVMNAFKARRQLDNYTTNIARALYRSNPPKLSTDKKIKVHAPDIAEEALKQFNDCYSKDFVVEAALMPDAHGGYVAPIGSVIKTRGAVVPSWVGYDIGCGMIAVQMSDNVTEQNIVREKAEEIFNQVYADVPMGVGKYNRENQSIYLVDKMDSALERLKAATKYNTLYEEVYQKSKPSLGTLGAGNHFIEVSVNDDETWLVIHSGSRNVGLATATYFMKAVVAGLQKGHENTVPIVDPDMRDEYMHYQDYCLEYALLNRMSMAIKVEKAVKRATGIEYDTYKKLWTNKNHNHCIKLGNNLYLHRKGATSSDRGERGVIPGNMRDGCYLVEGLGNDDFLRSSSHGAGREMSRTKAQAVVKLDSFKETMAGIVAPVNQETIDESPFAYKNLTRVMEYQKESVKVLKHLKPIINWKGY